MRNNEYYHQYIDIDGMPLDLSLNKSGEPKILQLSLDDTKLHIADEKAAAELAEAFNDIVSKLNNIARLQGIEAIRDEDSHCVDFRIPAATASQTFEDARKCLVEIMQKQATRVYGMKPAEQPDITPMQIAIGMDWDTTKNEPIAQMLLNPSGTTDDTGQDYARWLQAELKSNRVRASILPEKEDGWVVLQFRGASPKETYASLSRMHMTATTLGYTEDLGAPSYIPRPHLFTGRYLEALLPGGTTTSPEEVIPKPSEVKWAVDNMPRKDGMDSFNTMTTGARFTFAAALTRRIGEAMGDGADLKGAVSVAVNALHQDLPPLVSSAATKGSLISALATGIQNRMQFRGDGPPQTL